MHLPNITKEHYLDVLEKAGLDSVEVLQETPYMQEDKVTGTTITSLDIKAVK